MTLTAAFPGRACQRRTGLYEMKSETTSVAFSERENRLCSSDALLVFYLLVLYLCTPVGRSPLHRCVSLWSFYILYRELKAVILCRVRFGDGRSLLRVGHPERSEIFVGAGLWNERFRPVLPVIECYCIVAVYFLSPETASQGSEYTFVRPSASRTAFFE